MRMMMMVNQSVLPVEVRGVSEVVICSLILILIAVVAILGNLAVIYAIFKSRRLREQASNLLIINLSVTDLLSAILVMCLSVVSISADLHTMSRFWCNLQCAANYCLIIVCMMTLAFISIDRYMAVVHPLKYTNNVTKQRVLLALIWPWVQGLAFAFPPVWLQWVHYDYWEAVCAIDWHQQQQQAITYVIIACIMCFVLPACIMLYCYFHIIRQARKCQTNIQPMCSNMPINHSLRQAIKTITSLVVVVIVFFVCMTPFCITKLLKVVIAPSFVPGYLNLASSYLVYLASVANPFIYGIFRREFRLAYRHFCWHLSCKISHMTLENIDDSFTRPSVRVSVMQRRFSKYSMNQGKAKPDEVDNDVKHEKEEDISSTCQSMPISNYLSTVSNRGSSVDSLVPTHHGYNISLHQMLCDGASDYVIRVKSASSTPTAVSFIKIEHTSHSCL